MDEISLREIEAIGMSHGMTWDALAWLAFALRQAARFARLFPVARTRDATTSVTVHDTRGGQLRESFAWNLRAAFAARQMGCCASSYPFKPPNLTIVNGGFTSGLGEITTERTGYILDCETHGEKQTTPWSAYFIRDAGAGKVLPIRDHTGRVVYNIMPHGQARVCNNNFRANSLARMKMHITNAHDGSKMVVLQLPYQFTILVIKVTTGQCM